MLSIMTNRAKHLLIVALNSGATLHLAPGESSEVEDYELNDNERVQTLARENLLTVAAAEHEPAPARSRRTPRRSA